MAVHGSVLEKDHYEALGVAEDASHEDIQRAYRRLARVLVTIEVAVPQRLMSEQRAAVEATVEAMDGSPRTHLEV